MGASELLLPVCHQFAQCTLMTILRNKEERWSDTWQLPVLHTVCYKMLRTEPGLRAWKGEGSGHSAWPAAGDGVAGRVPGANVVGPVMARGSSLHTAAPTTLQPRGLQCEGGELAPGLWTCQTLTLQCSGALTGEAGGRPSFQLSYNLKWFL